ncbi:hypothetical protein [Dongia sp.]
MNAVAIRGPYRAGNLGFASAAMMRAVMSVRGHGVPADWEEAMRP